MERLRNNISECVEIIEIALEDSDLNIDIDEPVCILLLVNLMIKQGRLRCRAEIGKTRIAVFRYRNHFQDGQYIYYPDKQFACNTIQSDEKLRIFSNPSTRTWTRFMSVKNVKSLNPLLTKGNFFCDLILANTGLMVITADEKNLEIVLNVCGLNIVSAASHEALFRDEKLTTITEFKYDVNVPLQIHLSALLLSDYNELTFEEKPIMRYGKNLFYKMRKISPGDIYKQE